MSVVSLKGDPAPLVATLLGCGIVLTFGHLIFKVGENKKPPFGGADHKTGG